MASVPMVTKASKTRAASDPAVLSLQCPTSLSRVLLLSAMSAVLWSRGCQECAGTAELGTDLSAAQAQPLLAREGWGGTVAVTAFLLHAVQGGTHSACASSSHRGLMRKRRERQTPAT